MSKSMYICSKVHQKYWLIEIDVVIMKSVREEVQSYYLRKTMDPPSSWRSLRTGSLSSGVCGRCGSVCACVKAHAGALMCIKPLVCYSRTKAMTLVLITTPVQGHGLETQTGGEDGNKCNRGFFRTFEEEGYWKWGHSRKRVKGT